ncbi:unnamed protein product, partial [Adineta ricciae]
MYSFILPSKTLKHIILHPSTILPITSKNSNLFDNTSKETKPFRYFSTFVSMKAANTSMQQPKSDQFNRYQKLK